jgi:hypothetical protein
MTLYLSNRNVPQLIASGDGRDEPIQLIYPDRSTTVAYKSDSWTSILNRESSTGINTPREDPLESTARLFVFASLSGPDEIRTEILNYRRVGLGIVGSLAALSVTNFWLDISSDGSFVLEFCELIPWVWIILFCCCVLFILAVGRNSVYLFTSVSACIPCCFTAVLYNSSWDADWVNVSIRITTLLLSLGLWLVSNKYRNSLTAGAFLVKQVIE